MSILSDGTIKRTIHKQSGHGPYLWAVIWSRPIPDFDPLTSVSVFSFWEDANRYAATIQANGGTARLDLAVDYCRAFAPQKHTPTLAFNELLERERTR